MKLYFRILASFFILISFEVRANENYFNKAKDLFDEKKFEDSKFLFQRNIVFNPKDASSYLYLAKIYDNEGNKKELEKNLNTTLLLEPNNEEANYMLIDIELKRSNFSKVREMTKKFEILCISLCNKISSINERLNNFQENNNS
tara:strand:+ start:3758 stop:4189 length:432 start_codon:yes stop_codon:yes gene_type:complete